jgi:hypothetical protein
MGDSLTERPRWRLGGTAHKIGDASGRNGRNIEFFPESSQLAIEGLETWDLNTPIAAK